ncbi:MAG: flagellar protein FlaG [Bryobacterales bacterium]|nr:flagellar protein FlaG [Bryobacterales bacterium]
MDIGSVARASVVSIATQPAPTETPARQQELIRAVQALNASEMFGQKEELTFAFDRESRRFVMRLVDRKTREVVRQIPPEHALRMAEQLNPSDG